MAFNKETGMWEGFIYYIENLVNGKGYIGQTTRTVETRWKEHISASNNPNKTTSAISKAISKYGVENFYIVTISEISRLKKECLLDELDKLEILLIDKFNTHISGSNGYNITDGGQCGIGRLPTRVISFDINGNKLNDFNSYVDAANYYNISYTTVWKICNGKSSNHKNKIVFRNEGDPFEKYLVNNSSKIYYDVFQFDTDGHLLGKFSNVNQAFEKTGIYVEKNILDSVHSLRGGYWWSNSPVFNYKGSVNKGRPPRPVDVYSKDTLNYIETIPSIGECARKYNLDKSVIRSNCNGKYKTSGGYIFRFHGDSLDKYDYRTNHSGPSGRKVNKYTKDGEYLHTYNKISEAQEDLGIASSGGISSCCRGVTKTAYGFKWFYASDKMQPDKSKIIS